MLWNKVFVFLTIVTLIIGALTQQVAAEEKTGNKNNWEYGLQIYLWGSSIGGTTATGDDLDISFTDLAENLDFAFMTFASARKDKWSLLVDVVYLDVSGEDKTTANLIGNPVKTKVEVGLTGWVINLVGSYTAVKTDKFMLDVLAGARYLYLDADLEFDIGVLKGSFSDSFDVWDGIIGVRGKADLSEKWYLYYHLDMGTGDTSFTWQALAGFGYQFKKLDAVFGYRYLEWNFDDDDPGGGTFDDLNLQGPYAGVRLLF
jgi:hypothetical protein